MCIPMQTLCYQNKHELLNNLSNYLVLQLLLQIRVTLKPSLQRKGPTKFLLVQQEIVLIFQEQTKLQLIGSGTNTQGDVELKVVASKQVVQDQYFHQISTPYQYLELDNNGIQQHNFLYHLGIQQMLHQQGNCHRLKGNLRQQKDLQSKPSNYSQHCQNCILSMTNDIYLHKSKMLLSHNFCYQNLFRKFQIQFLCYHYARMSDKMFISQNYSNLPQIYILIEIIPNSC
ncbi:unnamed protein product [Paramecium octaurelia]|uniref:Uncharacterized protein n=1 Tax=Paramecium octaurelia TaxID=43137 RepID=A0A8S1TIE2_PAROT|nr:unnamed protein product [Paramecium octaurelia]